MTDPNVTEKSENAKALKPFPDEMIDQLLAQVQNKDAESILGESGLAGQLKKQLAERMLAAELTHHLETEANINGGLRALTTTSSACARGMSVREIQGHALELYGLQVSPDLISTVTDEVLAGVEQWQQRPAARGDVPHRRFRRPALEDPRRRHGQEQGGESGAGYSRRRAQGSAGPTDRTNGRRQVLAESL